MGYVATFDAGTTAVKAALTDDDGIIIASCSSGAMPLFTGDGHREQDPFDWWRAFLQAAHAMLTQASQSVPKFDPADILGIIMSGQMQDVIALDGQLNPVRRAMLYSDGRADREAGELAEIVGDTTFHNLTGNQLEGSLPLPKLMWFKRHEPQNFAKTRHVLFDAKDYLVARLTGALSADVVASSTVGAMDICRHVWSSRLIDAAGMDELLFPALRNPEDRVGEIAGRAAETTGFALGTPVFAGIGDAGATTLASGVTKPGEYNINIGTSGWIAAISPEPITDQIGVANLACTHGRCA
jgi:xylulokinase